MTTRKHAMKIWEVSLAVDCQTKMVKCGYAAKKNWSENNSTSHWLYLNQQVALVKKTLRNSELLEFFHLERYEWCNVIFVSPYFQFCLCAEAVMGARFSFVVEGIKETEWSKDCSLLFSGSLSFQRFLYGFCFGFGLI